MPIETNQDVDNAEPIEAVNAAMVDIIVEAFRCDLTRVVSVQFSGSVGYHIFASLGHTKGHHDMTHDTLDNELVDATNEAGEPVLECAEDCGGSGQRRQFPITDGIPVLLESSTATDQSPRQTLHNCSES